MDTLLTTRQLQDLLQVDRMTIYRMLHDGHLPGFKVGGQWRFPRQAIEQWLQEQQERKAALTAPGVLPSSSSALALPLSCVQAIQDLMAEALEVGMVTTAPDGTPLTRVSRCGSFCALILDTEGGRQRCVRSWRAAVSHPSNRGKERGPQVNRCHAGLGYVSEQVEVSGELVAVICAGQSLVQPPGQDNHWPGLVAELSRATGLAAAKLQEALAEVPVLDREKWEQLSRFLRRVAVTFSEIGHERLSLLTRLQRIAEMTQV